jgi:hypothetical protein
MKRKTDNTALTNNLNECRTRMMAKKKVRSGRFPGDQHCYKMIDGEEEKFLNLMK